MDAETFINSIEGTINDVAEGLMDRGEAVRKLSELFTNSLKPVLKTKEHLELFIYRVTKMRELQKEFFLTGQKKVLADAKKHESIVDNAIKKLITELGYDIKKLNKKGDQQNLFNK